MKFRDNQTRVFAAAILVAAILVFLNLTNALKPFKGFSYWLFKYPQILISKSGFKFNHTFDFIMNIKNSEKKLADLADENSRLKQEISELKEVRHENDLLRSALNLPLKRERTLLDADIIGKDPYGFSGYLAINRGSDSGISAGMDAVDANGFFVGKISEISSSTAKIRTLTDNSSSVSAVDQESRVQGIVKSDLNSGLIFDMVSQDAKVELGDTVIVSLTGFDAPEGIAKIVSAEKYPNKPFQKIKLAPLADLKNIEKVFIIMNPAPQ